MCTVAMGGSIVLYGFIESAGHNCCPLKQSVCVCVCVCVCCFEMGMCYP